MNHPPTDHGIEDVTFVPGTDAGPLTCRCGWEGDSTEYAAHRKEVGARRVTTGLAPLGPRRIPM